MDYSLKISFFGLILSKIKYYILPSKENNNRSKLLQSNILLYFVILVVTLRIITTLTSIALPQNIFFADIAKITLENFVNQTRKSIGLSALNVNEKLNQAAMAKAENMVQNNYFDHTSPSGITPWFWFLKAGYNYKYAGENLAIGFYESEEVFNAWLNSPSHKANIINPNYTEVGTAVLSGFGGSNSIVVVQEFGSPILNKTTTAKNVSTTNSGTKPAITVKPTEITQNPEPIQNTTPIKDNQQNIQVQEKVLSETTDNKEKLNISEKVKNTYLKIMNGLKYGYDSILQSIIFGLSLIVMGILLTLILFNFKITFTKQLVYRAVIIIVLLSTATIINKDVISSLIPHQILI